MANHRCTYQQVETVSIKRDRLIEVAEDTEYGKNDFRVFLVLLSQLDGFCYPENSRRVVNDPLNFKKINLGQIADTLSLSKKQVKKSVDNLYNDGLLEMGSNNTVKDGYRFTF